MATKEEYEARYALWNEFNNTWSIEKLKTMSLEEYTKAGDKDTFSYWIESRLDKLGSIWGGSAFKFGIFSRKDKTDKEDGGGAAYSDDYGWYSKYGAEQDAAFTQVRKAVVKMLMA